MPLETSGLRVSSRWARLKLTPAAQDYLSPLPPGTAVGSDVGSGKGKRVGELTPERQSREHFAVLAAQVQSVDWLELHPDGHRRARFSAASAVWLTP